MHTKLTKSQAAVIQDYMDNGYTVRHSNAGCRVRVFVRANRILSFVLYIGKRGKLYDTETGDV